MRTASQKARPALKGPAKAKAGNLSEIQIVVMKPPLNPNAAGKWRNPEWINRVSELATTYPDWGCDRIAYYLHLKGMTISAPTVQRILNSQELGTVAQRRSRSNQP
jgi:hypothetical protein